MPYDLTKTSEQDSQGTQKTHAGYCFTTFVRVCPAGGPALGPLRLFLMPLAIAFASCSSPYVHDSFSPEHVLADYQSPTVPGAAIVVLRQDSILFRAAYGMADLSKHTSVTPQTNFRLASVSKQFTSAAILLLIRGNQISFDTKLTEIFKDFPPYGSSITVRHLLTHTSGLASYESLIPDSQTVQVHDRDVLLLLSSVDSTYFPPGSQFRYSNSGYAIPSLIVESVARMPFAQFLEDRIFLPAGMTNTVAFEEGISSVPARAFGYNRTDGNWESADQSVTSAVLGDGGIYSSIEDLTRWNQALSQSVLLGKELQTAATSPQVYITDSLAYGFGWYVRNDGARPLVYHTGSTRGFRTALLRYANENLTVILLTNRNEGDVLTFAETIASHFLR